MLSDVSYLISQLQASVLEQMQYNCKFTMTFALRFTHGEKRFLKRLIATCVQGLYELLSVYDVYFKLSCGFRITSMCGSTIDNGMSPHYQTLTSILPSQQGCLLDTMMIYMAHMWRQQLRVKGHGFFKFGYSYQYQVSRLGSIRLFV